MEDKYSPTLREIDELLRKQQEFKTLIKEKKAQDLKYAEMKNAEESAEK